MYYSRTPWQYETGAGSLQEFATTAKVGNEGYRNIGAAARQQLGMNAHRGKGFFLSNSLETKLFFFFGGLRMTNMLSNCILDTSTYNEWWVRNKYYGGGYYGY